MKTKLVAITQPLVGDGNLSASDFIVYCARVSNPQNQLNTLTGPKLLAYCIKHGHWSIFEQASMTVEIVTSRAIAAQIIRHRSFCFQEYSQRYANALEMEPVELRTQDLKNRQASGESFNQEWATNAVADVTFKAWNLYRELISQGVSRETARMILPLCTRTTLYMTGSVRSWIHYFEQRCAKGTQKEHRDIAMSIRDTIFAKHFKDTYDAMLTHGHHNLPQEDKL
jgi:thymidylate synthase (FAD)